MNFSNEALIALIGTLFGGVGLKTVEAILAKNNRKLDDAAQIRKELREETAALKVELKNLRQELDEWKEKYFNTFNENSELKFRLESLQEDNLELTKKYNELYGEFMKLKQRFGLV